MRRYIGDVISKWNNVGERMNESSGVMEIGGIQNICTE